VQSARGPHSRRQYASLVARIRREGRAGLLQVRSARSWHQIWFVGGSPVWYESDLLGDGEAPASTADGERSENQRALVERGAAAALAWDSGEWSWEPLESLPAAVLGHAVSGEVRVLRALWQAAQLHLPVDEALAVVAAPGLRLSAAEGLAEFLGVIEAGPDLVKISELLENSGSAGVGADEIFRALPNRSGNLIRLLWLLDACEAVRRTADPQVQRITTMPSGPSAVAAHTARADAELPAFGRGGTAPAAPRPATSPGATRPVAMPGGARPLTTPSAQRPVAPAELARGLPEEWKRRMLQDYFQFLEIHANAAPSDVEAAAERLTRRWTPLLDATSLPDAMRRMAGDLVAGAQIARRTLLDPQRRAEYERRARLGQAPKMQPIRAADPRSIPATAPVHGPAPGAAGVGPAGTAPPASPAGAAIREARRLAERGDGAQALAFLRRARMQHPSSPDVLAELGWLEWKHGGGAGKGGADSPESYVRLALTFEPRHPRAAEYMARMSHEQGQLAVARRWAQRLLELEPESAFATDLLRQLAGRG
jgi:hypothetical protein